MAQIAKLEAKAEITSPPAKVYDFFKYNLNNFVHVFPQVFKSAKLIEGEEGCAGNVKLVEYVLGKAMSLKVKTDEINDGERSMTMRAVEGDILQLYSTFVCKISITDGSVNWSFEFEKNNESAPNPDDYAKLATKLSKVLDLYLLSN
ncbi:kirola-like [Salvia miltiorrhiza]|uniref:kirola-like n=1 Tax=Salvia miltiorrhiza TaxID=226208 RepID=UPI0025ACADB5|nr:kirola-like [Salvia miltiorrhiza]